MSIMSRLKEWGEVTSRVPLILTSRILLKLQGKLCRKHIEVAIWAWKGFS